MQELKIFIFLYVLNILATGTIVIYGIISVMNMLKCWENKYYSAFIENKKVGK